MIVSMRHRKRITSIISAILLFFGENCAGEAATLLDDNFSSGFDPTKWYVKPWDPAGSTYIDGTQFRVSPYIPPVHDGFLDLTFSTYNPSAQTPGDSFFGTQIISHQEFVPTPATAVKVTTRARFIPPVGQTTVPSGIIGSEFLYKLLSSDSRDEIDVEVLTKPQIEGPGFLTNVFVADPFSAAGDVDFVAKPAFDFRSFHDYSFIWATDSITWYLDGQLVRRETASHPTANMALYFNTWAPLFGGFSRALDPSLHPASSAAANIDVIWQLDSARVETVPPPLLADYNGNHIVDAADYTVWRNTLHQSGLGLAADGNGDGTVNFADYSAWKAHFGQSAASGGGYFGTASGNANAPEPSALFLMVAASLGAMLIRR